MGICPTGATLDFDYNWDYVGQECKESCAAPVGCMCNTDSKADEVSTACRTTTTSHAGTTSTGKIDASTTATTSVTTSVTSTTKTTTTAAVATTTAAATTSVASPTLTLTFTTTTATISSTTTRNATNSVNVENGEEQGRAPGFGSGSGRSSIDNEHSRTAPVVGIVLGTVVLIIAAVVVGKSCLQRRSTNADLHNASRSRLSFTEVFEMMKANGDIDEAAIIVTPREIRREFVQMLEELGAGAFGKVWKGILDESSVSRGGNGIPGHLVAIKTAKEGGNCISNTSDHMRTASAIDDLKAEAAIMAQVGNHKNVVSIIGVVTVGTPALLLVSYCEHGSLLNVLQRRVAEVAANPVVKAPFCYKQRLFMMYEVALGMEHLTKLLVHRDLAARNILVDSAMTCKVADFGLSRGIVKASGNSDDNDGDGADYYRSASGVYPVRSTAPEAMLSGRFTAACDVWSFGVLGVEVWQDGRRPFDAVANADLPAQICAGLRPTKPDACNGATFELIQQCWKLAAADRVTFPQLVRQLSELIAAAPAVDGTVNRLPMASASAMAHYEYADVNNPTEAAISGGEGNVEAGVLAEDLEAGFEYLNPAASVAGATPLKDEGGSDDAYRGGGTSHAAQKQQQQYNNTGLGGTGGYSNVYDVLQANSVAPPGRLPSQVDSAGYEIAAPAVIVDGSNRVSRGGSSNAYGGVMYVATRNQNGPAHSPEYAAGAGSTNAAYSVVSREGRGADTDRDGHSYERATPTTAFDSSAYTHRPFQETSFVLTGHMPVRGVASPADKDDGEYLLTGAEAEGGNADDDQGNDFV